MSGGGKGQVAPTTSDAIAGSKPAYLKNAVPATQAAFLPGQLDYLSKQLSAGFGPPPAAFVQALQQTYQPAQTMNFGMPKAAPKPVVKPKPKPTSPLNLAGLGRNAR